MTMSEPPKPTPDELYPLPDPAVIAANRKKREDRQRELRRVQAEKRERAKIPVPHVGIAVYFAEPIFADQMKIGCVANLLVDARWPWAPWWASYSAADPRHDGKGVRVGGKNGTAPLVAALQRRDLYSLRLNRSHGENNDSSAEIDLHALNAERGDSYIAWMTCKSIDLPAGKTFDGFVALTHEIIEALGADHAVIGAWPTYNHAVSDASFVRIILDTPTGDLDLGTPAAFAAQRDLASSHRYALGRTYARHPRWGTYLHAGHVAAIGGVERIRAVVDPAVIAPVGPLTYVQLTPSIAMAMTAEAEAKRQAFEQLMAPILPGAAVPPPPPGAPVPPPSP